MDMKIFVDKTPLSGGGSVAIALAVQPRSQGPSVIYMGSIKYVFICVYIYTLKSSLESKVCDCPRVHPSHPRAGLIPQGRFSVSVFAL